MTRSEKITAFLIFGSMGIAYLFISIYSKSIPNPIFSLILTSVCLIYFYGYKKINLKKIPAGAVIGISVIFAVILFFTPIKNGSDVINYILGSRVAFIGKLNPYIVPYSQFTTDPIYQNFKNYGWVNNPYPYSPLFLYIGGVLLFLSRGNFLLNVMLFRVLFLLTFIASSLIIRKITKGSQVIYLFSLNPIILNELVREAHVESLLVFWVLMSIYFYYNKRFFASFLSLLTVVSVKIYYILFIPFFLINLFRSHNLQVKQIIQMVLLGLFILTIIYIPFWQGTNTFLGITRLTSGESGNLMTFNFLSVSLMPFMAKFYKNPFENYINSGHALSIIGAVIMVIYAIKVLYNKRADFISLIKSLNIVYLIFLFFLVNWFFPHYATTLIFFGILLFNMTEQKKYFYYTFFLTFYSSLYYIILA